MITQVEPGREADPPESVNYSVRVTQHFNGATLKGPFSAFPKKENRSIIDSLSQVDEICLCESSGHSWFMANYLSRWNRYCSWLGMVPSNLDGSFQAVSMTILAVQETAQLMDDHLLR